MSKKRDHESYPSDHDVANSSTTIRLNWPNSSGHLACADPTEYNFAKNLFRSGSPSHRDQRSDTMQRVQQGDLALLQHPASQELLHSKIPARLAYVWTDGTPRVVPIWFHWNGRDIVMASPPKAPKLKALARNPKVSMTIDDNTFPHKVLLIRGSARLEAVDGIVPEYAAAADRYFGPEQGKAWVDRLRTMISSMVRVTVAPEWVGLLDFETRFPSALAS
jgi:hypothetical protein